MQVRPTEAFFIGPSVYTSRPVCKGHIHKCTQFKVLEFSEARRLSELA